MPAIRTERYWMAGLEKPSRSRERRALILQTATDLFLEHGYAGTSTDAIVQRSSVSKQTVYAHFGSKEELFRAAIEAFSTFTTRAIDEQPLDPSEPVVSLRKIGTNILKALTARRSLALLRLIIAESGREPEVRETFLRYGPESSERTVADFLRKCARAGSLEIPDPVLYSKIFTALVTEPLLSAVLRMKPLSPQAIAGQMDRILPPFLKMCSS
jgi:AcrR family transcriptional regulator